MMMMMRAAAEIGDSVMVAVADSAQRRCTGEALTCLTSLTSTLPKLTMWLSSEPDTTPVFCGFQAAKAEKWEASCCPLTSSCGRA